jgi:hypothetical protein
VRAIQLLSCYHERSEVLPVNSSCTGVHIHNFAPAILRKYKMLPVDRVINLFYGGELWLVKTDMKGFMSGI